MGLAHTLNSAMADTKKTATNSAPTSDAEAPVTVSGTFAPATTAPALAPVPAPPRPLTPEQTVRYEELVRSGVTVYDACAQARGHEPMKA